MSGAAPMISRVRSERIISTDLSEQYDYCMVFKRENDANGQPLVDPDHAKYIIHVMKDSGLDVYPFYSVQQDELLCLIRCGFDKMRKFADDFNFKMELSPEKVKSLLAEGVIENKQYVIAPVKINDDMEYTPYNPYNFIYGKYESDLPQDMYLDIEEDPRTGGNHFTKYVRLKLLYYILKAPTRVGGCNLQISNLLFAKKIEAFFPLHETNITNRIASASGCCSSPWSFPFTQFRNYFGEKISLYMVFIGHYSKWLIVPSIVGILFQLVVWGTDNYSSPVLPFYAVLITVWAIMMIEYWKREEKSTAMIWGMIGFEHDEPDRPEFVGDLIKSYIDGGEMYYFSKKEFGERVAGSVSVIGAFILLLLGVVASIYVMRFALEPSLHANASTLASICNTIQITIFNMIYQKVVVALTDAENHRTDTEYEDSMTVKLFAFQFINSYASFFFLAFIAQNLDPSSDAPDDYNGQCGADTCMKPLSVNLAIIFCTRIASGFATNVIAPKIQSDMKRRSEGGARNLTPPEMNYALMNYNTMIEGINNYADAALQFGFSILFVTALPLAPFMSLVANWARIKGMAWKLCRLYQRPIPLGAEDIGTWMPIFQFVAIAAVVTNGGLVCFTMNSLSEFSNWGRVWVFVGFQWVLIGIQFIIQSFVPDEPEEVAIQMKRQAFITSKVIDRTPDEDPVSVEAYETEQRQSLARFVADDPSKSCCNALCGRNEKQSALREMNFNVGNAQITVHQYPTSTGNLGIAGTTHNPMGGY